MENCLDTGSKGFRSMIVSLRNIKRYTHKVSGKCPTKYELNEDDNNEHAKQGEKNFKRPQPYTMIYRKLNNVGSVLPQGRTHRLVAQNQMVSMNIHKNNIVYNLIFIFRDIFVFTNT